MPSHTHCIMVNHRGANFYCLSLSILFTYMCRIIIEKAQPLPSLLVLMLTSFWVTLVAVTHYLQLYESRYINEYHLDTILTSIRITVIFIIISDHGPTAIPPPPIATASSRPMATLSFVSLHGEPSHCCQFWFNGCSLLPYRPGKPSHCCQSSPNGCSLLCHPSEPSHYCQFSIIIDLSSIGLAWWTLPTQFCGQRYCPSAPGQIPQHEWLQTKERWSN